MKLDPTTLRLVRAASQAIADECTAILEFTPPDETPLSPTTTPESVAAAATAVAARVAAKRARGKAAAPAEPVVVTDTPPVTNVEQPAPAAPAPAAPAPAAPAPAAPAPAAPAPVTPAPAAPAPATTPPPQSTVTDQELAALAEVLKADPEKLRLYQAWRDSSEFLQSDGTLASGKGLPLSKIPNVGDNRDRLLEALKRALV